MMDKSKKNKELPKGPICKGGKQNIIYAWAMDAPKLVLPEDVAFKVGGNTDKKYFVMQVHYANIDYFKGLFN
jgi:peptidylglycine monooxygenase